MINYVIGMIIVALLVYSVIKVIEQNKTGGGCAGCSTCIYANSSKNCNGQENMDGTSHKH